MPVSRFLVHIVRYRFNRKYREIYDWQKRTKAELLPVAKQMAKDFDASAEYVEMMRKKRKFFDDLMADGREKAHRETIKEPPKPIVKQRQITLGEALYDYSQVVGKSINAIHQVRYLILTFEMLAVVMKALEAFTAKTFAEVGPLPEETVLELFTDAFPHTSLAKDWRMGVLRGRPDGEALPVDVVQAITPHLPPEPVWLKEGKDPQGYWRGDDPSFDALLDFFAAYPDWVISNRKPPDCDTVAVYRKYKQRFADLGSIFKLPDPGL